MAQAEYVKREMVPSPLGNTTVAVTIGAVHNESAAIPAYIVRLVATAACFVAFGTSPVATASSMYLAPNVPERFAFNNGDLISALQAVGGGTLYITY
jgi:hypothetical protein